MANQLLVSASRVHSDKVFRSLLETKPIAGIEPSSRDAHVGLYVGIIRGGSVRSILAGLRFFSGSAACCDFVSLIPLGCAFVFNADGEPFADVPFTFERVFGAMLSSVPEVTSRALPFVDGDTDTTEQPSET